MKPSIHLATSFFVGVVIWFFTKSIYAGALCLASGVLVDSDHFIEFGIQHGWKNLTLKNVYEVSLRTGTEEEGPRFTRLYLIFHTAEIAILFWVAFICTQNIYLLAIAAGYSSHLILDSIGNTIFPHSYFMIWRIIKKFDTEKLSKR